MSLPEPLSRCGVNEIGERLAAAPQRLQRTWIIALSWFDRRDSWIMFGQVVGEEVISLYSLKDTGCYSIERLVH